MGETLTPRKFTEQGEEGFGYEFVECYAGVVGDFTGGKSVDEGDA